jgi:uncharacterized membrane protein YfcA
VSSFQGAYQKEEKKEVMFTVLGVYLIIGFAAGLISGLFGIGGGLVIVPSLIISFKILALPEELWMHMAIGTSLATILFTVSQSAYAHSKQTPLSWDVLRKIAIPTAVGTIIGGLFANTIGPLTLKIIFGVYVSIVSLKMWFDLRVETQIKSTPNYMYYIVGLIIGFKSAILGIGGGTISIPFLNWRGFEMKKAVGISACLGVPIAFFGAATYAYNGLSQVQLPSYTLGYIYLPALVGIVSTSSLSVKYGVKLSHRLNQKVLRRSFAILLMIIAIRTLAKILL